VPDGVRLGNLVLSPVDVAAAVSWVVEAAHAERPAVVVTSNIHHLHLADTDPEFRRVVAGADLNVADGWPLVAASRLVAGTSLPGRVAGVDLVDAILTSSAHLRIAVLGGPPGAASRLADRLRERHDVVLVDELPKGAWEREEQRATLERRVSAARPTLTLIGIGAPRQELLAATLIDVVAGPIICCGATIEFLAGVRARAPRGIQALGLEWAFRMLLEPRRLAPRYARAAATFVRLLLRERTRFRADGRR
jgi:N-acetylglucosaminyldiphosphoundecaprenol N-acetyl-beta-D-mannosaminyltransferase